MMPKDVFVMRAPQPEPEWNWSRWLRATETSLEPTPLLLLVRDRFDEMEDLLRRMITRIESLNRIVTNEYGYDADDHVERLEAEAMLAEIDAAKASG